ncbi:MAG: phosphorylase [Novosphingobium sp.]
MSGVLAVTGTRREASVLHQIGVMAIAIGGSGMALDKALAARGKDVSAIISFGMGGALNPDLKLGDWVVGTNVCGGTDADCDLQWAAELSGKLPQARGGSCYADGRLIGDSREKQFLFGKYGAVVADMESHLVANAAARLGIPFAILRCISDEAQAALPPAIAVAMHPDGSLALGAIVKSILTNPGQLPQLWRSTARFNSAFASLEAGSRLAFSQS